MDAKCALTAACAANPSPLYFLTTPTSSRSSSCFWKPGAIKVKADTSDAKSTGTQTSDRRVNRSSMNLG
eukprot:CAMPEP_0173278372 /NCGR_PEP_ID=MMETSP1143-20121109/4580_1 /TAXON_ID=483371 /ORGANISM="non described non described, Strain CCMP2298" /LENGTH=68 /DNA_ID=CAMNT_0014215529 /DNA_START=69 /DNA_END=271 /DNA_ORIENTATION=+